MKIRTDKPNKRIELLLQKQAEQGLSACVSAGEDPLLFAEV
jgi:hypothetical protein